MQLDYDNVVRVLNLYECVQSEIVCNGEKAEDFNTEQLAERVLALWNSNAEGIADNAIDIPKYALILKKDEIECLVVVLSKICGSDPDNILKKVKEILVNERYA